ncbi:MAG: Asp-tRNA(Asn)/Glu-tRNA(Gln) amidotransferase GatCAB subunit C [Cycloclasticus sp.]|nr:Asp-tRNA(Asn)/Glu-tRNA(Gln) amidotransferase GatCAB subunit C [Cycloclasticus sp.]MBG96623.1 Asp-tRNA(Asn)/Glu-tRNA(Gln) amidotransferase GatCAB subunit C [Cycloclasticus sp.]HAI96264.1 Asp-tRNA(Asn)/Glu-tRNA(Gln) amidotransferase GatCAB subunit C [Methylococcaceae bacterium]|tara:strand:- start:1657 stop:1944 length:288 start_codon:yes stop_codon:yes gene_type:complete
MSIQSKDVLKIAHLARLGIRQEQVESYASDLSNIVTLVEQMNQVDTSDIEPMAHPLDQFQRLRADVVSETNQREILQQNAPDVEDGLFLVPRVID